MSTVKGFKLVDANYRGYDNKISFRVGNVHQSMSTLPTNRQSRPADEPVISAWPEMCKSGFHFCLEPLSCLLYTNHLKARPLRLIRVEAQDQTISEGLKYCTNRLIVTGEIGGKERDEMLTGVIKFDGCTFHYREGELHRDDGPAVEENNGNTKWFRNGLQHRDDGPAILYPEYKEAWLIMGHYHRIAGPAIKYADGREEWYSYGQLDRKDGPAVTCANGKKEWYEGGKYIKSEHPEEKAYVSEMRSVPIPPQAPSLYSFSPLPPPFISNLFGTFTDGREPQSSSQGTSNQESQYEKKDTPPIYTSITTTMSSGGYTFNNEETTKWSVNKDGSFTIETKDGIVVFPVHDKQYSRPHIQGDSSKKLPIHETISLLLKLASPSLRASLP